MGMRCRAALTLTVLLATGFAPGAAAAASYKIIVHPSVKGNQIPRATLNSIFLKYSPRWGDGSPVLPVDQSFRSRIRQAFANEIHQRPMMELRVFWTRRMETDEDVVAFVAATPGAIGYVAPTTPLPDSVRPITIIE
jgi:ABC-type phosphate transport system substrate-binding protein